MSGRTIKKCVELYIWFYNLIFNQCPFICPICGLRCGGIEGHKGKHQCAKHGELY